MTKSKRRRRLTRAGQAGFTILEVMIVLGIIALIMGVVISRLTGQADEATERLVHQKTQEFAGAYERWKLDHSTACPQSIQELADYVGKGVGVKDEWDNELVVLCGSAAPPAADGFGILSKGRDGRQGSEDDIRSWVKYKKKQSKDKDSAE
jgi:general secretion pathway protein G